jgi:mannose-6-phosphate isomerase
LKPLRLPANQLHRFYRGGQEIARFRGLPHTDAYAPEDWIGATNTIHGEPELGLSRLENGQLLRDAVAADPEGFLGPNRTETSLLVKLLDTGQRLPVHIHPDRTFAREHLGSPYGKTEAWVIVQTRNEPLVWLGFRDQVDEATLANWVESQDAATMLAELNKFAVTPGDVVFVPAGVPHAIGGGILMVELQEPTDFSILLEWEGYAIDGLRDGHLGLGFETALRAVDRSAWTPDQLTAAVVHIDKGERIPLLPPEAAPFFAGERLRPAPRLELEQAFAILIVLSGFGRIDSTGGGLDLRRGQTLVVPFSAGPTVISGQIDVIRCLPAAPQHSGHAALAGATDHPEALD